ncbi:LppW family protein [Modestobacter altitudinis]|uniref:LppW family protein n=1 Tax=Modestobacter altitudinis TaxID=2213158 RepID=UPI00110CD7EF|nr:LppW family protein [Modestobacter altitudinis]
MVGSGAARVRPRHRLTLTTTVLALTAALASSVGWCSTARAADPHPAAAARPLVRPVPAGPPATLLPGAVPPAPVLDPAAGVAVLAAAEQAAGRVGGTVYVAVRDPSGAELLTGQGAGTPVLTASLVKLLVVQQLFARDAAGSLQLSPGDLDRMRRAVVASDDGAMSVLWDRFDGAELVVAAAAEFGLTGSSPPARAGQWGEAVTTAADTALFLSALADHLPADDLATLTGWMGSAAGVATDGFDQRFGLLAPAVSASTAAAVKQGWMCCIDSRRQLHSAGVLADGRVVVLLGDFPTSTGWSRARAALDSAAQAVVDGT